MVGFISGTTLLWVSVAIFILVFVETWMAENRTTRGKYVFGQALVLLLGSVIMSTESADVSSLLLFVGVASAMATGCALFLNHAFVK